MIKNVIVEGKNYELNDGVKTIEIEGFELDEAGTKVIDFRPKTSLKIDGFKGVKVELYADNELFDCMRFIMVNVHSYDMYSIAFDCLVQLRDGLLTNVEYISDSIYAFGLYNMPEVNYCQFWLMIFKGAYYEELENKTNIKAKVYYYEPDEITATFGFEY